MSDDIQLIGPDGPGAAGGGGSGKIRVWSSVLAEIDQHVESDTTVEQGGVLVGDIDPATGTTVITARIPAVGAISEVASLRFTHETWDHINAVMERDHPDARMVGWYHSHPHFGIFLSEYDQFIHNNFFSQPWQVAYVVDPLLRQRGFFAWVDGSLVRVPSWETWRTETGEPDVPVGTPPPRPAAPAPPPPVAGGAVAPGPVAPPPPDPDKISPWSLGVLLLLVFALVAAVIAVTDPFADDEKPAFQIRLDGDLEREATAGQQTRLGRVTVAGVEEDDPLAWTYLPTDPSGSPPEAIAAAATPAEDDGNSYRLTWQSDDVHDQGPRSGVLLAFPCPTDTPEQECLAAGAEIAATPIALTLTSPPFTIPTADQFVTNDDTQPYVDGESLALYDPSQLYPPGVTAVGTLTVGSTVIDQLDVSQVEESVVQGSGLAPHLGFPRGDEVDRAPALSEDNRENIDANDLSTAGESIEVNVLEPGGRAERSRDLACGPDGVSRNCRAVATLPGDDQEQILSTVEVLQAIADVPDNTVAGLFLTLDRQCPSSSSPDDEVIDEEEIGRTMNVIVTAVQQRPEVLWVVPDTDTCANLANQIAGLDNVVTVNAGDDERYAEVEVRAAALPSDEDSEDEDPEGEDPENEDSADQHTADALDAAALVMGAAAETWSADPGALTAAVVVGCLIDGLTNDRELRVNHAKEAEACNPEPAPVPDSSSSTAPSPPDETTTDTAAQSTDTTDPTDRGGNGRAGQDDG